MQAAVAAEEAVSRLTADGPLWVYQNIPGGDLLVLYPEDRGVTEPDFELTGWTLIAHIDRDGVFHEMIF